MSDQEIKIAKERLDLEERLSQCRIKLALFQQKVKDIKSDMEVLLSDPDHYFLIKEKIENLLK